MARKPKKRDWTAYRGPWGEPRRSTTGLYPGLVLNDKVLSGSITAGHSRLPLWAMTFAVRDIQQILEDNFNNLHGWDAEQFSGFIHELLEMRGEFGRLLLVLANAERLEGVREGRGDHDTPWWAHEPSRKRIAAQLRKCLDIITEPPV